MTYIKSKRTHLTHTSHRHSLPSCHTQWHPHPMHTYNEKPQPHIPDPLLQNPNRTQFS